MADLAEVIFFLQFVAVIGILLARLYNMLDGFTVWEWRGNVVLFVTQTILYGLGLTTAIVKYNSILITVLHRFEVGVYLLTVLFAVIEYVTMVNKKYVRQRYTPDRTVR